MSLENYLLHLQKSLFVQAARDPNEMQMLISADPDFAKCVARKTFIYALGRATALGDIPCLEAIVAGFENSDCRFADLVVHLVTSDVFRQRRGDPSM